jgi:hypothetical protein
MQISMSWCEKMPTPMFVTAAPLHGFLRTFQGMKFWEKDDGGQNGRSPGMGLRGDYE